MSNSITDAFRKTRQVVRLTFASNRDAFKAAKRGSRKDRINPNAKLIEYINNNIPVIRDDDFLSLNGCPTIVPSAMSIKLVDDTYAIIVNDHLLRQEYWFKEAVYKHEIGHIMYHLPDLGKDGNFNVVTNLKNEIEADRYAFLQGTQIKKALKLLERYGINLKSRLQMLETACV